MLGRVARILGQQSVAVLALCVALSGGTAYAAAAMWTGANIVDGSLTGADIADGSITSTDLAPGAVAGSASTHLTEWNPASISGPWWTSDPGLNIPPLTIATQAFTVPADGFVLVTFSAKMSFASANPCPAAPRSLFTTVRPLIDGFGSQAVAGIQSDGVAFDASSPGSQYLTAGTHTLSLQVSLAYCPITETSSIVVQDAHVVVSQV